MMLLYLFSAAYTFNFAAALILLFIAVIGLSSVFILPAHVDLRLLIILTGTLLLTAWHTKNFDYCCPSCGEVFEISTLENFPGPNGINKKYLRFPKCGKRDRAETLRIKR